MHHFPSIDIQTKGKVLLVMSSISINYFFIFSKCTQHYLSVSFSSRGEKLVFTSVGSSNRGERRCFFKYYIIFILTYIYTHFVIEHIFTCCDITYIHMFSTRSKPTISILDKNLYKHFVTEYTCFQ